MQATRDLTFGCAACGERVVKTMGWLAFHDSFLCEPCGARTPVAREILLDALGTIETAMAEVDRVVMELKLKRMEPV